MTAIEGKERIPLDKQVNGVDYGVEARVKDGVEVELESGLKHTLLEETAAGAVMVRFPNYVVRDVELTEEEEYRMAAFLLRRLNQLGYVMAEGELVKRGEGERSKVRKENAASILQALIVDLEEVRLENSQWLFESREGFLITKLADDFREEHSKILTEEEEEKLWKLLRRRKIKRTKAVEVSVDGLIKCRDLLKEIEDILEV